MLGANRNAQDVVQDLFFPKGIRHDTEARTQLLGGAPPGVGALVQGVPPRRVPPVYVM